MTASLNKVQLIGFLGKDPDVRYMPNGDAAANFSLATNETWKDKEGKKQERTEWHNIVAYASLAEIAGKYLKKGSLVYVEGRLRTRKWQDKNTGTDRYTTEVTIDALQMLPNGSSKPEGNDGRQSDHAKEAKSEKPQQQGGFDDGFDDDIPY